MKEPPFAPIAARSESRLATILGCVLASVIIHIIGGVAFYFCIR